MSHLSILFRLQKNAIEEIKRLSQTICICIDYGKTKNSFLNLQAIASWNFSVSLQNWLIIVFLGGLFKTLFRNKLIKGRDLSCKLKLDIQCFVCWQFLTGCLGYEKINSELTLESYGGYQVKISLEEFLLIVLSPRNFTFMIHARTTLTNVL